jgi:hypothetical protein
VVGKLMLQQPIPSTPGVGVSSEWMKVFLERGSTIITSPLVIGAVLQIFLVIGIAFQIPACNSGKRGYLYLLLSMASGAFISAIFPLYFGIIQLLQTHGLKSIETSVGCNEV